MYNDLLSKKNYLLEKYNEIRLNVKDSPKREFNIKPVYNKKYLKAKIKSYNGKINKKFCNIEIPNKDSKYVCLSIILLDAVSRTGRSY